MRRLYESDARALVPLSKSEQRRSRKTQMPQTSQMLAEYPEIHLQVIAEFRGAFLEEERNVLSMIDSLGGQITDPTR